MKITVGDSNNFCKWFFSFAQCSVVVRIFWETHKIWKNLPHGFEKSADLLSKRQNHEEDFFKLYVLLKKSELYMLHYPRIGLEKYEI